MNTTIIGALMPSPTSTLTSWVHDICGASGRLHAQHEFHSKCAVYHEKLLSPIGSCWVGGHFGWANGDLWYACRNVSCLFLLFDNWSLNCFWWLIIVLSGNNCVRDLCYHPTLLHISLAKLGKGVQCRRGPVLEQRRCTRLPSLSTPHLTGHFRI